MEIKLHHPSIGEGEVEAVAAVLRSGWITQGPKVEEFEEAFANACGDGCIAVAVSSCTAGLHMGLLASVIHPDNEVAVPVWTYAATLRAIELADCMPVFCDVDPLTLLITGKAIDVHEKQNYCGAYMPVHMAGSMTKEPWGNRRPIIQDAAHCLPYDPGADADAVFSFNATKPITAGGGGMYVTQSPKTAKRIRRMRSNGFDTDSKARLIGDREHQVLHEGFRYYMTDIQAALGLVQLGRAERMRRERCTVANLYRHGLRGCLLPEREKGHSHHLFIVHVPDAKSYIAAMAAHGVECGRHYRPLHHHAQFREVYTLDPADYPGAEEAAKHAVSLPIWAGLDESAVGYVISKSNEVLAA